MYVTKKRHGRLVMAGLVSAALLASACGSDDDNESGSSAPAASSGTTVTDAVGTDPTETNAADGTAAASGDPIIIGASVAKTGSQTFYGGPAMIAAQEAIKDLNAGQPVNQGAR